MKSRNNESPCNGNLSVMDCLPLPGRIPYASYVKGFPCSESHYNGNLAIRKEILSFLAHIALCIVDFLHKPIATAGATTKMYCYFMTYCLIFHAVSMALHKTGFSWKNINFYGIHEPDALRQQSSGKSSIKRESWDSFA